MEVALFVALCGTAIAADKLYGNNLTYLETKIINGREVDTHITINMGNALASIERNQKHTWTGIFLRRNFVLTTGKVAEEIHELMGENNAGSCIRVCYLVTPVNGNCIPVLGAVLHAEYLFFNVEHNVDTVSLNPHDVGVLVVNSNSEPRPIPWLSYALNAVFVSDAEYQVLGWEFQSDAGGRYQKLMKINLVEHNTCLNNYGVVVHDHNIQVYMGCFEPAVGTLQKEDIGALVVHDNVVIGIVSHIDKGGKPAVMTLIRNLPGSTFSIKWLYGNQIDHFYKRKDAYKRMSSRSHLK